MIILTDDNALQEIPEIPFKFIQSFPLDPFQKNAITCIAKNENVLVSAPTGCGKTEIARYAIIKTILEKKIVIYCSPIKSLSNQKFCEFKKMFEGLNDQYGVTSDIGILTGDNKFNPNAQCLIMTTEILRNMLYKYNIDITVTDFINKIGCIIFDEVHYINDPERGRVWEETIILLPKTIILVMLSATVNHPEKFAKWIETSKEMPTNLVVTSKRVIPLTHYGYLNNQLCKFMDNDGNFFAKNYDTFYSDYKKISSNVKYRPLTILNPFVTYLEEHKNLPALFFTFSRNNCEKYAHMISKSLLAGTETNEVDKIFNFNMHKFKQYINLPQVTNMYNLLMKGIAVHHSGLIPVLKEIIEILFAKGFIKVLFCTETFAVGVNMPTKTVVFSEIEKFDGKSNFRCLRADEYRQMAGRAGRRGKDDHGTVILLPIKELLTTSTVHQMMTGESVTISSKFSINYQFILKAIQSKDKKVIDIINSSMLNSELIGMINYLNNEIIKQQTELNNLQDITKEYETDQKFNEYIKQKELINNLEGFGNSANKQKKQTELIISQLEIYNSKFSNYYQNYLLIKNKKEDIDKLQNEMHDLELSSMEEIEKISYFLRKIGYLTFDDNYNLLELTSDNITTKGIIASEINECNEILFTELITNKTFNNLTDIEIATVCSIFIQDNKDENDYSIDGMQIPKKIKETLHNIEKIRDKLYQEEINSDININTNWQLDYSFVEATYKWIFEGTISSEIYEGNFIRNIIKINNICENIKNICELTQNQSLQKTLELIESKLVKDIISNESLYIY